MERIKQVILIRKDLNMRRGKEIAQGSHASMQFLVEQIISQLPGTLADKRSDEQSPEELSLGVSLSISRKEAQWMSKGMAKVCLRVDSEEQLLFYHQQASNADLKSCLITDSGRTEFKGKPTITACAIGPDFISSIDAITGALTPY